MTPILHQTPPLTGLDPRDRTVVRQWGHDLRASLAALSDHLRLLNDETLSDANRTHLSAALTEAEAMARLIGAAVTEFAGENTATDTIDLAALQREIESVFAGPAARAGAHLSIRRDRGLPERLDLERVALERILRNLVGNALTHAHANRISVEFHSPAPQRLGLRVRDDGPGFATEGGAPHPRTREQDHGLGLGIVSSLVAEMGGRWGLRNLPAGGAEVWVDLPCSAASRLVHLSPSTVVADRLGGVRILAVDDNDSTLHLIAALLSAAGAWIDTATSGLEAIGRLEVAEYDLLIVDATMPRISGAQVIRALRARPDRSAMAPALAMTADTSAQCHDELIAAGANRVVTKPLPEPGEFLRIAERLLKTRPPGMARPAPPALPEKQSIPDDLPLFDPDPLRRIAALAGAEAICEILDRLVADLTETLARIDRASEPSGDGEGELRSASHVLIALAGTAGAMRLLDRAQLLNKALQNGGGAELAPLLAEIRLLTRGAIAAISRFDVSSSAPDGTVQT